MSSPAPAYSVCPASPLELVVVNQRAAVVGNPQGEPVSPAPSQLAHSPLSPALPSNNQAEFFRTAKRGAVPGLYAQKESLGVFSCVLIA